MTDSVRRALGIDQEDLSGKLIMIEERHGSDGNFVVNSILSKSLENRRGICLVLFHNTFGHYHNIGMKLGYNLNALRDSGVVSVVEPMKYILHSIEELGHDSVDPGTSELEEIIRDSLDKNQIPEPMKLDEKLVQHLFVSLRRQYYEMKKINNSITIIVDDITHLFDLNLSLKEVWFYARYLKSLMDMEPKLAVCILGHSYQTNSRTCYSNSLVTAVRRISHLYVEVEPLSTGHSRDVSGLMSVVWRTASIRLQYHWPERTTYLYKLLDRQIKLFTPGGVPVQC